MRFVAALLFLLIFAPTAWAVPPAPVITAPAANAALKTTTVTVSGTTTAATTVAVLEAGTKLGDAVVTGNTWSFDAVGLAQGPHTVTAVATDADGDSPASAERHFTVDPVAPDVTFTGVPPSPTNVSTFDVGFTADEPDVRFDCVHVFPDGTSSEQLDCHS